MEQIKISPFCFKKYMTQEDCLEAAEDEFEAPPDDYDEPFVWNFLLLWAAYEDL